MRIAITGGTGFVGQFIIKEAIKRGYDVAALVRADSKLYNLPSGENIKIIHYLNVDEPELVQKLSVWKPDTMFHIAWKGVTGEFRDQPHQFNENIKFTLDTVELAGKGGCKKWIGAGSQAEYGLKSGIISENTPCEPVNAYGKAKLAAGIAAMGMCDLFNMKSAWGRIFSTFGPNDYEKYFIPYIIGEIYKQNTPEITMCEQIWDYLYIKDAANAFLALAENNDAIGNYNIASGRPIMLKDIVEKIKFLMGSNNTIQYGKRPYADKQVMHLEGDISKITKSTGWVPSTSLDDALKQTIQAFKK